MLPRLLSFHVSVSAALCGILGASISFAQTPDVVDKQCIFLASTKIPQLSGLSVSKSSSTLVSGSRNASAIAEARKMVADVNGNMDKAISLLSKYTYVDGSDRDRLNKASASRLDFDETLKQMILSYIDGSLREPNAVKSTRLIKISATAVGQSATFNFECMESNDGNISIKSLGISD